MVTYRGWSRIQGEWLSGKFDRPEEQLNLAKSDTTDNRARGAS